MREKRIWGLQLILAPFFVIGIALVGSINPWVCMLLGLMLSTGCRLFVKE